MAEVAPWNAQITAAPVLLPRQTDGLPTSLIGYWSNGNTWEAINCVGSGETWSTLASFAGCKAIHTGCTKGASRVINQLLTCGSSEICVSLTIHSSTPVESLPDPNAKTQFFCQNTWSDRATHLYRQTTTPTPSSSSRPSSSPSSTLASSTSDPSSTASSSPSPSSSASTQNQTTKSNNTGAIAGGAVAGVALALVIGFLIWYFGFHRRKQKQASVAADTYPMNYPSQMDYSHQQYSDTPYYAANPPVEVDSGTVKYSHVGELPADPPRHASQLP